GDDGHGKGYFLDPTPEDWSEYTGQIDNAFVGEPDPDGPAAGLHDLYSIVEAEIYHVLGENDDSSARLQTSGYVTATGGDDQVDTPGKLWTFVGPTVSALLTTNNGGPGGSSRTRPLHIAQPQPDGAVSGVFGVEDGGNASFAGPDITNKART